MRKKSRASGFWRLAAAVLAHERRSGCVGRWSWRKSRHGKRQHIANDMPAFKDKENGEGCQV